MPRGRSAAAGSAGGLDALISEIGQRLGESLGQAIAAGIMQGVQTSGLADGAALGGRRKPGRPPRADAEGRPACLVPNCGRPGVAKGLCATHYRKARRLKMGDTFSQTQLDELAQDARKTRFQKG